MWRNKLAFVSVLLACTLTVNAQQFLGKTKKEILQFVEEHKARVTNVQQATDSITFVYEEEDELMRLFEVSYCFNLKKDACFAYKKVVPVNTYWAKTIQDLATQRKGTGSGDMINVDGEQLYSHYEFDDFLLDIKLSDDLLVLVYKSKK